MPPGEIDDTIDRIELGGLRLGIEQVYMAKRLDEYKRALHRNGFTDDQAWELVRDFHKSFWDRVFHGKRNDPDGEEPWPGVDEAESSSQQSGSVVSLFNSSKKPPLQ